MTTTMTPMARGAPPSHPTRRWWLWLLPVAIGVPILVLVLISLGVSQSVKTPDLGNPNVGGAGVKPFYCSVIKDPTFPAMVAGAVGHPQSLQRLELGETVGAAPVAARPAAHALYNDVVNLRPYAAALATVELEGASLCAS